LQLSAAVAQRALLDLPDQLGLYAELAGQLGQRFAAGHVAFCAKLCHESFAAGGVDLATEPRLGLEHQHAVPSAHQRIRRAQASEPTSYNRNPRHGAGD
jgi:hypothetical protein